MRLQAVAEMEMRHGMGRPHGSQKVCCLSGIHLACQPEVTCAPCRLSGAAGFYASSSVRLRLRAAHMQAVAETMMARDGRARSCGCSCPRRCAGPSSARGGATIRSFAEDSQAAITVSPQACAPNCITEAYAARDLEPLRG